MSGRCLRVPSYVGSTDAVIRSERSKKWGCWFLLWGVVFVFPSRVICTPGLGGRRGDHCGGFVFEPRLFWRLLRLLGSPPSPFPPLRGEAASLLLFTFTHGECCQVVLKRSSLFSRVYVSVLQCSLSLSLSLSPSQSLSCSSHTPLYAASPLSCCSLWPCKHLTFTHKHTHSHFLT